MLRLVAVLSVVFLAAVACGGDSPPGPSASSSPPGSLTSAPLTSGSASAAPSSSPATERIAITNATLFDGTGAAPVPGSTILLADGRIERVYRGPEKVAVEGYREIDVGGATVMPGLIDGHVHISRSLVEGSQLVGGVDENGLVPFVRAGFTTLRDVGTATVIFSSIKYLSDRLEREGRSPDIVWAGPLVTTTGGYPISNPRYAAAGQEVASAEEGVALVDELHKTGAIIIKMGLEQGYYGDSGWPLMPLDQVRAITDRAHQNGMLVAAHVTSMDEVRLAIDGGVNDLAHSPLEPIPDDVIQEMLAKGMGIVTTATIWQPGSEQAAENARRYADAGGKVSIGTDFGCCQQPAGIEAYLAEMEYLQNAGMSTTAILVAATKGGAQLANLGDQTGTIEPGKEADIIVLDSDPFASLEAFRSIRTVISDGRLVFEKD